MRVDGRALADQQRRQPTGGQHGGGLAQLGHHPPDDPVDLASGAEEDAGLQRLDRVLADHRPRPGELDLEQLSAAGAQGINGDLHSGGDGTAEELPLRADRVERGGGAEVHHHGGAAVEVEGPERVDHPVRPHLFRVVGQDWHAGAHARLHHDRRHLREVVPTHLPDLVQDRRHGRARRDAGDHDRSGAGAFGGRGQQAPHQQRELVSGAPMVGRDPPVVAQLGAGEDAEHRRGVAHVDGEQHQPLRRSTPMSSAGAEWVSAPIAR